jgi:hypothetical protein
MVASMANSVGGGSFGADACAELRQAVGDGCEVAHRAAAEHAAATDRTRALKRDLVAAQHRLEAAVAADDGRSRAAEKAAARRAYLEAQERATTEAELSTATAEWARAVDRINRGARLAGRAVAKARTQASGIEATLHAAERDEQTARIRADVAESACLEARVRLAACEERMVSPPAVIVEAAPPTAPLVGQGVILGELPPERPLVIEAMLGGDQTSLELAAGIIAEHAGRGLAEVSLQLSELIDAIVSAASADGYLVFDEEHPLWARLTREEAHDVVAALARLGFMFEPREGWAGGRAPSASDLAMALGYAGLDTRHRRDLPVDTDLRGLPGSITVDARAFLAALAPDLAVDQLVRVLGERAGALEPLWDVWGQVRPVLLSEVRAVGGASG